MLDRLQAFFQSLSTGRAQAPFAPGDPRVAVAALCIQVMESDGVVRNSEKAKLRTVLRESYKLTEAEIDALLAAGRRAENEAVDYYRFTSELNRHLDEEQKRQLVGILWEIVYADGMRSELEDHVVWRIADLLGVPNRDHIHERLNAAARAPEPDRPADE